MRAAILICFLIVAIVLSGCVESTEITCPDGRVVARPWLCDENTGCPEDAKVCPDGSTVSRNPELNCEFDPCPVIGNPTLEFSFGECDQSVDPYNPDEHGVRETSWLDDTTLEVKAIVSINCVEGIESGDFEIVGENITLVYNSPKCGEMCALCKCAHELLYKFSNLEKKDYTFELKRTKEAQCKKEGETIPVIAEPPECCSGLTLIPPIEPQIVGISGYCTEKCGNGTCDTETESAYNCPVDCEGV